jgi:hypothetical protein
MGNLAVKQQMINRSVQCGFRTSIKRFFFFVWKIPPLPPLSGVTEPYLGHLCCTFHNKLGTMKVQNKITIHCRHLYKKYIFGLHMDLATVTNICANWHKSTSPVTLDNRKYVHLLSPIHLPS